MFEINYTCAAFICSFTYFCYFLYKFLWFPIIKIKLEREKEQNYLNNSAQVNSKQAKEGIDYLKKKMDSLRLQERQLLQELMDEAEETLQKDLQELKENLQDQRENLSVEWELSYARSAEIIPNHSKKLCLTLLDKFVGAKENA